MKNKLYSNPVSGGYKRVLTLLVMLLAMTSAAVAHDFAVKNSDGVTIYYKYGDKSTVYVTRHTSGNPSYSGDVVIPGTVVYDGKTYTVTGIGARAFEQCSVTSVTIPSSVKSIEEWAFAVKDATIICEKPEPPTASPYAFSYSVAHGCKLRVLAASVERYSLSWHWPVKRMIPIMTKDPHLVVKGVRVTEDNLLDVLGDGGSVKYDGVGKLTLNNATVTGAIVQDSASDIDIEVNGECTVTGNVLLYADYNIIGSGTLNIGKKLGCPFLHCTVNGPTINCQQVEGEGLYGVLTVKKGTVRATDGVRELKNLTLGDGIAIQTPVGGTYDQTKKCVVDANGNEAADVVIGGLTNDLKIYVGDELVTATNMYDVLDDGGSVKYDGVGKLTLNNATVNGTDYALRTRVSKPLEIEVIGSCSLNSTTAGSSTGANTMALATNTTFTGTGQLVANKGINVLGAAFTVNGPYVRCNGGDLQGCQGGEKLAVKSGKLYARIIQGFKEFTLGEGIAITTPEGAYYDTSKQRIVGADGTPPSTLGVQIGPGATYIEATSLDLSETSLTLTAIGATATLQTVFTPANATNKTVKWTTSNEYVATVNNNGKVTAKGQGTATITAKAANGQEATCKVTVNTTVVAQSLSLNKQELTLRIFDEGYGYAENEKLVPVFEPANVTDGSVDWDIEDESVATINAYGRVQAVGFGTTTVTCTAKDGSGLKATCTVKVVSDLDASDNFDIDISQDEEVSIYMACHITDRTNNCCEVVPNTYDPDNSINDPAINSDTEGAIVIPGEARGYRVTRIDDNAFTDCDYITSITLSEGLQTIGYEAFHGCSGVETLFLPSTLISIDDYAFAGCPMVKDVYLPATTPPEVGETAFNFGRMLDYNNNDITATHVLHVPAASLKFYREQDWVWDYFAEIVPIDPVEDDLDGDGEVSIADAETITDYLLGKGNIDTEAADIDGDGEVTIADVTALIQKILEE